MKLAYLFHGHSRTWKQCYQNFFDNLYSVAPGDIYIHTWNTTNQLLGSWWTGDWDNLSPEAFKISETLIDLQDIYNTYNPKIFIVQKNKEIDLNDSRLLSGTIYKAHLGVKFMLESGRAIFEAASSQDNYDKFISTRLDINFTTKLSLEELNSDELIVESYVPQTSFRDLIIIGSKKQLDIKTNFVKHVDEHWHNHQNGPIHYPYESALYNYLAPHTTFKSTTLQFNVPRCF